MSRKFEKNREVDSRYLNVPVKYILNYTGANEDGKDKYEFVSYEEWLKEINDFITENPVFESERCFLTKKTYQEEKDMGLVRKKKIKEAKDKTLCIIDFYGNDKALVGWRNNKTCKMGMTKIYPVVKKGSKYYLNYKDNLILISNVGGWVI